MNFIVNSSGTVAIRMSAIDKVEIVLVEQEGSSFFVVRVGGSQGGDLEQAETLQAAQALALPILQALEA